MRLVKRQEIYRGREKYIFFPSLYIFHLYRYRREKAVCHGAHGAHFFNKKRKKSNTYA